MDLNRFKGSVRVIDAKGANLGVMSVVEAQRLAYEQDLDLVVVQEGTTPVCRIMDRGKWEFERKKKEKESRQHTLDQKEIRFSMRIADHDLKIKQEQVKRFLEKGHSVRLFIRLQGRENYRHDLATEHMKTIIDPLQSMARFDTIGRAEKSVFVNAYPIKGKSNVHIQEKRA